MGYADHFSIQNIPYGIATGGSHSTPAVVTRLGDNVYFLSDLDLPCSDSVKTALTQPTLNALAATPKGELRKLRASIQSVLSDSAVVSKNGIAIDQVQLHLPVKIEGFTDFSCSKEHLLNAGEATFGERFMPPAALHYPIGYGGRASSIVVSGTPIVRPHGQFFQADGVGFGPSKSMDYELEMGCIIGKPSKLGEPVSVSEADEHIFGIVIVNDWSSRDLQKMEMKPLGPLCGKSFGTTLSPWVVTLEALEPFACEPPAKDFEVMPYLRDTKAKSSYDVELGVEIIKEGQSTKVCTAQLKWMYWTFRDLVAQLTINGCNVNTGDLLATGTVSGVGDDEHGCLLEMTMGGKISHKLVDGQERMWLEDGDEVRLTGYAGNGVGFGDCTGILMPARSL